MISTVAVGTDGSDTASAAVDAAVELAERFQARLVLLSAFKSEAIGAGAARLSGALAAYPEWSSNAAEQVERILATAEERISERGIECSSAMAEGDPGEVLVELAEKHRADVLVVGNKGMERRLLGSVPNTVSHRATCAVLVVKTT